MDVIEQMFADIFRGIEEHCRPELAAVGKQFPFEPFVMKPMRFAYADGVKVSALYTAATFGHVVLWHRWMQRTGGTATAWQLILNVNSRFNARQPTRCLTGRTLLRQSCRSQEGPERPASLCCRCCKTMATQTCRL